MTFVVTELSVSSHARDWTDSKHAEQRSNFEVFSKFLHRIRSIFAVHLQRQKHIYGTSGLALNHQFLKYFSKHRLDIEQFQNMLLRAIIFAERKVLTSPGLKQSLVQNKSSWKWTHYSETVTRSAWICWIIPGCFNQQRNVHSFCFKKKYQTNMSLLELLYNIRIPFRRCASPIENLKK